MFNQNELGILNSHFEKSNRPNKTDINKIFVLFEGKFRKEQIIVSDILFSLTLINH